MKREVIAVCLLGLMFSNPAWAAPIKRAHQRQAPLLLDVRRGESLAAALSQLHFLLEREAVIRLVPVSPAGVTGPGIPKAKPDFPSAPLKEGGI